MFRTDTNSGPDPKTASLRVLRLTSFLGENERENEHKRAVPPAMPTPVVVHVYDVSTKEAIARINSVTKPLGGVFHAGVEVLGREWSYGYCPPPGTGVFCVPPRSCEAHVYRESIALGACALDAPAVARLLVGAFPA